MMIGKILGVCVLTLTLTGCFFQSVSADKINSAKELCKEHDSNLYSIHEYWSGNTDVICVNKSVQSESYSLGRYLYDKRLKTIAEGED